MSTLDSPGFARRLLFATAGLLIWAANFLITYAFAALACARGFVADGAGLGLVSIVTFVSCALAVLANGTVIFWACSGRRTRPESASRRRTEGFIDFLAAAMASLSILAVLWTAFVGALPGGCAPTPSWG